MTQQLFLCFPFAVVQSQSELPVITVNSGVGTFLLFLVLFAGTRAGSGTDWGQTGPISTAGPNMPADTKTQSLVITKQPGTSRKEASSVRGREGDGVPPHQSVTFDGFRCRGSRFKGLARTPEGKQ